MARHKLPASMTAKCSTCHHGKASHNRIFASIACAMKHCRCAGFNGGHKVAEGHKDIQR